MTQAITMKRYLKVGSALLEFPEGENDPEAVKELYVANYPFLEQARLGPEQIEGDKIVYEAEKPPVKTKG